MKKTIVSLITLLLLTACGSSDSTPYQLKTDEAYTTYTYTIDDKETEYTLTIPLLEAKDDQVQLSHQPIYSLNPKVEFKAGRGLTQSTFYKNDDVDTFTKDRLYNYAYYGFGFWYLNASGLKKVETNALLNKNDYEVLYGDFYHENDFNNQDYIKYYLATQELIWESMTNEETGEPYKIQFQDIDVTNEKSQILETQKEYSKTPFFNGSVINVSDEQLAAKENYELEDANAVLGRYQIEASKDIELLTSDKPNTLSFKLNDVSRNTKIKFIPQFKIKDEISQVYSSNDGISYLSIGQERANNMVAALHFEKTTNENSINLAITTYDDETKVEIFGAQYQISTGPDFLTPIESTVSENGVPALIEKLAPGTYYIQQIVAPEGYALNQQVEEIKISNSIQEMTYPVYNQKIDQ